MNCLEAESLFDALLDGELSGPLRLELDAHRLRCHACQQKLALLEACEHTLSTDLDVWTVSHDFTDSVMARIAREPKARPVRTTPRWLTPAAAVLPAAAALLLAAGLWFRSQNSPTPVPSLPADVVAGTRATAGSPVADLYGGLWQPFERVQAATLTMKDDFSWLGRYAATLQSSLAAAEAAPTNPVQGLLNVLLFGAPDSLEAADAASDEASL